MTEQFEFRHPNDKVQRIVRETSIERPEVNLHELTEATIYTDEVEIAVWEGGPVWWTVSGWPVEKRFPSLKAFLEWVKHGE